MVLVFETTMLPNMQWRHELQELTTQVLLTKLLLTKLLLTKQHKVLLALQRALTHTQDAKDDKHIEQCCRAYCNLYHSNSTWQDDIAATCLASLIDCTNLDHASPTRRERKTALHSLGRTRP